MELVTVTESALKHMQTLIGSAPEGTKGLRVSVKKGGCSGYSYDIDFANEGSAHGEQVALDGLELYVDPAAIMFLLGSEIDYEEQRFASGFTFKNPNEKGRCGCGESIAF